LDLRRHALGVAVLAAVVAAVGGATNNEPDVAGTRVVMCPESLAGDAFLDGTCWSRVASSSTSA
jgi:hypothetical protein